PERRARRSEPAANPRRVVMPGVAEAALEGSFLSTDCVSHRCSEGGRATQERGTPEIDDPAHEQRLFAHVHRVAAELVGTGRDEVLRHEADFNRLAWSVVRGDAP